MEIVIMLIRYHLSFHWSMLHDSWFSDVFFLLVASLQF